MAEYCTVEGGVVVHASTCPGADHPGLRDRLIAEWEKPPFVDGNLKNERGRAKAQLQLVPPALVIATSDAMADGAAKYGPYNWREGRVELMQYLAAVQRHILAYQDGEDLASDSRIDHLSHAAAGLAIILDAKQAGVLVDDRPKNGHAGDMLWVRQKK